MERSIPDIQSIDNSVNNAVNAQQPGPDLGKSTIVVLVLLTLVISVIGTWTVLNEVSKIKTPGPIPATTNGNIKLNLLPFNGIIGSHTSGKVALTIK